MSGTPLPGPRLVALDPLKCRHEKLDPMGGRFMRFGWGILVLLLIGWGLPASAQRALSIKAFYGTWQGSGVAENADSIYFGVSARDFDVIIHPEGTGFSVAWTTVAHTGGDPKKPNVKRRQDKIVFVPSAGGATWRAAPESDPLGGQPYAWARIEGTSLIIYVFTIDRDGRYELQHYKRTLTGGGMDLVFTDTADGSRARSVKGKLIKLSD